MAKSLSHTRLDIHNMPIPRTSYIQLISRRVPSLAVWGVGLGAFLGWPHVWIGVSNKMHHVPPINQAYL